MECHRHPFTPARRSCLQCGRPVCRACQVRAEHHIFCSRECVRAYKWERFTRRAEGTLKHPVSRWWMTAALALLGVLFLMGIHLMVREFIIPATIPGSGRRPAGPEVGLAWSREGDLDRFTGTAPEDGLLVFPRSPAALAWLPVRAGRFAFTCSAGGPGPGSACWMPSRNLPFSPDYARGPLNLPMVSLTFDAGSEARGAEELLALLRAAGLRTTLFLTGEFIRGQPDLARRIVRDGHEVGNHTFSHPRLTTYAENRLQQTLEGMTRERLWSELGQAERIFWDACSGTFAPYWRAPFGEHNDEIRQWAWRRGYLHVGWTWDSLDWTGGEEGRQGDPRALLSRFAALERRGPASLNGAILLFHLGTYRAGEVREIIARLRGRGMMLVPVSTLLASQAVRGVK